MGFFLPNGESVKRRRMLYNKPQNAVFCFPYVLFGKKSIIGIIAYTKLGFGEWKHLNPKLKLRENSEIHRMCYMESKELEVRLRQNFSMDAFPKVYQCKNRKHLLKLILNVVLHCAKNNLPLKSRDRKPYPM